MIFKRFLVINSNGDGRIVARYPSHLRTNEVAFNLVIKVPDGWARLAAQSLTIELPPPPAAEDIKVVTN